MIHLFVVSTNKEFILPVSACEDVTRNDIIDSIRNIINFATMFSSHNVNVYIMEDKEEIYRGLICDLDLELLKD